MGAVFAQAASTQFFTSKAAFCLAAANTLHSPKITIGLPGAAGRVNSLPLDVNRIPMGFIALIFIASLRQVALERVKVERVEFDSIEQRFVVALVAGILSTASPDNCRMFQYFFSRRPLLGLQTQ